MVKSGMVLALKKWLKHGRRTKMRINCPMKYQVLASNFAVNKFSSEQTDDKEVHFSVLPFGQKTVSLDLLPNERHNVVTQVQQEENNKSSKGIFDTNMRHLSSKG